MSKKNIILIATLAVLVLLIYGVDLFKLNYRLVGWNEFGEPPITISHIQYFVADTPNIISYLDRSVGEEVTCYEAVAFVESDANETYRCCDTGDRISCLRGDFSSDIPSSDEQCVSELKSIFGVPDTLGFNLTVAHGAKIFLRQLLFGQDLTHPPEKVRLVNKRRGTISQTSQSNIQAKISTGFPASKAERGKRVACLQNCRPVLGLPHEA